MRISDKPIAAKLKDLGVTLVPGVSMVEKTYLGIGGTTDLLELRKHETIPDVIRLLKDDGIRHRFLGGGVERTG